MVAPAWHQPGRPPALHTDYDLRDLPVSRRAVARHSAAEYADNPHAVAIAKAARRLVELRDRWLNPPEWVEWVDEPVPGYPKRPAPRDETAAKDLKKRTLTNLYNARPQWLADAHADLDAAVAVAYGWPADISEDDAFAETADA